MAVLHVRVPTKVIQIARADNAKTVLGLHHLLVLFPRDSVHTHQVVNAPAQQTVAVIVFSVSVKIGPGEKMAPQAVFLILVCYTSFYGCRIEAE
jgi:hypothetical protein